MRADAVAHRSHVLDRLAAAPSTAAQASPPPRTPPQHLDITAAGRELVAGLVSQPWGQVSPSVYETGRLVTLVPWLTQHARRVEFLIQTQHPAGSWGPPEGYALVPTLSATEALLTTIRRTHTGEWPGTGQCAGYQRVLHATDRGLRRLFDWLRTPARSAVPDMPAIEIIVPALVGSLNDHLRWLDCSSLTGLDTWRGGRLHVPLGMSDTLLAAIRSGLRAGAAVPDKLLHCLEVAGDAARGAVAVRPTPPGTIGASPAATAAWLGDRRTPDPADPATRYLAAVVSGHGGCAPCGIPVTEFERAWTLSMIAGVGIDLRVPAELLTGLAASLGDGGTPGGAGLPADADTTAMTVLALAQLGVRREPDCLWGYETETHFCTWPGESNPSTTVNAHVLDAFGHSSAGRRPAAARLAAAMDKVSTWLREQQRADGSWVDRWHASPYYATVSCALALKRFGGGASRAAVHKAVQWVLDTQRPDGSWGRWSGTIEETSYAIQVLLLAGSSADDRIRPAAARGYDHLRRSIGHEVSPPLWHDKDLYLPMAIVRASALAALHLAQNHPGLTG